MTGHILSYSILSGIALACLYFCYQLTMSRTTLFQFNRICILLIYLIAGIAPFITFGSAAGNATIEAGQLTVTRFTAAGTGADTPVPVMKYILIIYMIGMLVMGLRLTAGIIYLMYLKFSSARIYIQGIEVRLHSNEKLSPFSWCGEIFLPQSMRGICDEELVLIITHEQAHLENRHWLDLIISNLTIVAQWYNPAAWLLHSELIKVHEFEADRRVINSTENPTNYQLLLIRRTAGARFHTIADSLNHSSLKKRITMMMKNQTKSSARLRALAMLPAVAIALCLTNSSCVKSTCDKAETEEATEASSVTPVQPSVSADVADKEEATPTPSTEPAAKIPEFEGGMQNFYKMLSEKIVYPREAMEKNIQGRVIVELTVGKNGEITQATVKHGIDKSLDDEAIAAIYRVKDAGGKFAPGTDAEGNPVVTTYVLPVSFQLN